MYNSHTKSTLCHAEQPEDTPTGERQEYKQAKLASLGVPPKKPQNSPPPFQRLQ